MGSGHPVGERARGGTLGAAGPAHPPFYAGSTLRGKGGRHSATRATRPLGCHQAAGAGSSGSSARLTRPRERRHARSLVAAHLGTRLMRRTSEISRGEIIRRLGDPRLALLDVLPHAAFEGAHIPGALSLPVAEIPAQARKILSDRGQEIAVYCGGPT